MDSGKDTSGALWVRRERSVSKVRLESQLGTDLERFEFWMNNGDSSPCALGEQPSQSVFQRPPPPTLIQNGCWEIRERE